MKQTVADVVGIKLDQKLRKDLEDQILRIDMYNTPLKGIGRGMYCVYVKSLHQHRITVQLSVDGKKVYRNLGLYPDLSIDDLVEARNAAYWEAKGQPKEKEMEEKKENAEPAATGNHQEPATPQAAAGAEARAEKDTAFADKISDLLFGIRSFSKQAQAAILTAAINAEVKSWQN